MIQLWLLVVMVAAIFMYGTSCHEQKHFLHLHTNVKNTQFNYSTEGRPKMLGRFVFGGM